MDSLVLELGLILGLACICIILFALYIAMAKVEVPLNLVNLVRNYSQVAWKHSLNA